MLEGAKAPIANPNDHRASLFDIWNAKNGRCIRKLWPSEVKRKLLLDMTIN